MRLLVSFVSALLLVGQFGVPEIASAQGATEVVVEWNRVLIAAITSPGAHPNNISDTRPYAMVHVAVFDALNSIDPLFAPYLAAVSPAPGASREAAAAQAAHDVATALMPTQAARFDEALAATLAGLDPGAAAAGSAVGAAAARAILERRADDGWERSGGGYRLPALPGYWQPTPPANQNATFTRSQFVAGFILSDRRALSVESPLALTSARYAEDFNEVKALGSATSTSRTEEQTQIARVWAGVGMRTDAHAAWNVAMQHVALTQNMSPVEAARMFALANMAAHDAAIVGYTGKYRHGLWRPVTAIREAERDGHPDTAADAEWMPLVTTPSNPTYPGNMACLAASQARVLARIFDRDDVPVTITWTATNNRTTVARSYNGFRQIADEHARSRQYGGVNFTFDTLASFGVCTTLADYAYENYLRRR